MKASIVLLSFLLLGLLKFPVSCGSSSKAHQPKAAKVGRAAPKAAAVQPKPSLPAEGPEVRINSPLKDETLTTPDVGIFYKVQKLPADAHLHVVLDERAPEELEDPHLPAVFRHLTPGWHVVRIFACGADHVSFKNPGALAAVRFCVGDATKGVAFDPGLPTLTFNLPPPLSRKTNRLPVDFVISGPLEHGQWRVRLSVDGELKHDFDWFDPAYRLQLTPGEHEVRMELLNRAGQLMKANFGWSERTVTVR